VAISSGSAGSASGFCRRQVRASGATGRAELQAAGFESLRAIAEQLDERGIPAARGGKWSAVQIAWLLDAGQLRPFAASATAA